MNSAVLSCCLVVAWNVTALMLFLAGGDYSRAGFVAGLVVLWGLLTEQFKRDRATLKSISYTFLALAAVYFMLGVDFVLDEKYLFSGFNAGACLVSLGVAIYAGKRA